MKAKRDNKAVPFPARLLTGALVLTGVMLVAMAWSGVVSYRSITTAHPHDLRIQELRGAIVHLDEVLTMSARMAAATGDSDWERHYRQFEPQLAAAIKEAMELTDYTDSAEAAAQTDAANLKLVEMENQSFALVRAGEAGRAKALLFSDTYAAQKKIYAGGMGELVQHLKEQLAANQRQKQRAAVLSIVVVAICIVLLFCTWISILRRLDHWRTMQSASVDALTRAEGDLHKLNDGLEDRTRCLQLEILERKQAEAALRVSGETFRQFAENITDAFWIRSPDLREVHYVSPAFERIWGRSVEILYANPQQWADFILPEDRERVLGVFAALAAGEAPSLDVEYRIVRPDGEVRWVHARGFQVRDAADKVIRLTGVVTDITERKRADGELHWKTAFLEAQVNSSIDGILVVDQEGKKSLQNQRFVDLFKIPQDIADEPGDENRLRWVTNRTRNPEQFIKSVLYLYAHPNEIGRDEIELKDGTILDRYSSPVLGQDGKYFGRIWTFRDITERKLAEEAMRESEERFSGAFEHAPIGMALVSRGGRWLRVNRALCALVGYSEAELLKRKFQDVTHPEDLETDLENVRRMLAGEIRTYQLEKRYIHARGHCVTVLLNVSLVRDGEDQPRYFVSQIQDITARKHAEAALEKAHQELVAASRQAGMAEAATGVLHNVSNVLNSVNVASTCLADSLRKSKAANLSKVVALLRAHETDLGAFVTSDPKGKQIVGYLTQLSEHLAGEQAAALTELAQLQKNIEHIKEVVTDQQRCAKGAGKSETLQVTDLVEDTLRMDSGGQGSRDIQVITEFEHTPLITVEKHKVLQILMNLVRNAKQSCHEASGLEKRLTLRVTNGDDRIRISVSDNGVGISPENLPRIFAHGFTTKKDGHGFGLHSGALAATELGGSLNVQSDGVGHGATFTLELPVENKPEGNPCNT